MGIKKLVYTRHDWYLFKLRFNQFIHIARKSLQNKIKLTLLRPFIFRRHGKDYNGFIFKWNGNEYNTLTQYDCFCNEEYNSSCEECECKIFNYSSPCIEINWNHYFVNNIKTNSLDDLVFEIEGTKLRNDVLNDGNTERAFYVKEKLFYSFNNDSLSYMLNSEKSNKRYLDGLNWIKY